MKNEIYIFIIVVTLIFSSCSKDDTKGSTFSPPQNIFGTWKSPDPDYQYVTLSIKKGNIIEEDHFNFWGSRGYTDFKKEFDSDDFVISEVSTETSYEVQVTRKDGKPIDEEIGSLAFLESIVCPFIMT